MWIFDHDWHIKNIELVLLPPEQTRCVVEVCILIGYLQPGLSLPGCLRDLPHTESFASPNIQSGNLRQKPPSLSGIIHHELPYEEFSCGVEPA